MNISTHRNLSTNLVLERGDGGSSTALLGRGEGGGGAGKGDDAKSGLHCFSVLVEVGIN